IEELRARQDGHDALLDAGIEGGVAPSFIEESQRRGEIISGHRPSESLACDARQDALCTGQFFGGIRRAADEDARATRRVEDAVGHGRLGRDDLKRATTTAAAAESTTARG